MALHQKRVDLSESEETLFRRMLAKYKRAYPRMREKDLWNRLLKEKSIEFWPNEFHNGIHEMERSMMQV